MSDQVVEEEIAQDFAEASWLGESSDFTLSFLIFFNFKKFKNLV